ncbi:hypothetical protein AUJ66_02285 [Candidatus Desantisbacteria bacterium CG1_02_38_46]|uniref:Uncharacterized protein n=2 Tax=unclassified Candidatus Desantisiibacteriota TaxID=3106372 RepID=A0A2H9P9G3_9BACT|nr:MAG: hypothetical protein AUJ66_02285 [Candidatus Desantisbacteria bacterium CG1_02_38_46]PIZ14892.1 MAG: hypothetical protein COY51_07035 [Candidatus Desantisbacteria bacterium CG_4_10_14_0_8_um_filter_39_17]
MVAYIYFLKFEIIGKDTASENYFMGTVSLALKQTEEKKEELEEEKLGIKAHAIEEKDLIGTKIQDEFGLKQVLFNTSEKDAPLSYQEHSFSGKNSYIFLSLKNEIEKYVLFKGNLLKYKDKVLFSSRNICSVSLGWEKLGTGSNF